MATGEVLRPKTLVGDRAAVVPETSVRDVARQVLAALASLRLTVVLFSLSIFLIFVGTLAQKDHDIWDVMHSYFQVWFARVEFQTFVRLLQIFAKGVEWNVPGSFLFPGGKLIGSALLINLFAAHLVRFKVAAEGRRLAVGLVTIALGVLAVVLAVQSGMNDTFASELSPGFMDFLWQALRGGLIVIALGGAYGLMIGYHRMPAVEWWVCLVVVLKVGLLAIWLLMHPTARLDDAGLRILWQLTKGGGAGLVLLAGCALVFRRRAGIVLLHGGVAMMMLGQMWTAMKAQEMQVSIPEGGTVGYSYDIHRVEIAVVDGSNENTERVTVIPQEMLADNVGQVDKITHADLPVELRVLRWLPNAKLHRATADEANPSKLGLGRDAIAEEAALATGGEDDKANYPAAYVELFNKSNNESLGTYLFSAQIPVPQPVTVNGKDYELALRFERYYWPFTMTLKEFRFDRYAGSDTAKNFSSLVTLREPERNVDRDIKIWMNNPLRYNGMTFYQSSFDQETEKTTVLQAVTNPGWMTPYVALMLVLVGLLAHFGTVLVRFVARRAREPEVLTGVLRPISDEKYPWLLPAATVLVFGGFLVTQAQLPTSRPSEMQIYEFGRLPVAYQGRIKPYDSLARTSLQYLSGRQELRVGKFGEKAKIEPAIRWLLDVIADAPEADDYRVFRIENVDLLNTLGLERRPEDWRYSLKELQATGDKLEQQIELAQAEEKGKGPLSLYQRKVLELNNKYSYYSMLVAAFRSPKALFEPAEMAQNSVQLRDRVLTLLKTAPHAVPPDTATIDWEPLLAAELDSVSRKTAGQPINLSAAQLRALLDAYAQRDATTFNQQLADFRRSLADYEGRLAADPSKLRDGDAKASEILSQAKIGFEVSFNQFSPFFWAAWFYVAAFVMGVVSWFGSEKLRRMSLWLLWLTFVVHTFALVGRIYISGRPPVTNLYSSAVFVGWGAVLLSLLFEAIHGLGLGNIVAAVIGFLTLLIAHFLSFDGDTMTVLQAVLDTQFWLATHVVCVATGYLATFVAGAFGACYIVTAHVWPVLDAEGRKILARMTYGALCFAIFFSFVGTVLGGLWGDVSWGRFWGWDPKENGALIIVLYNALILHARWGGLIKGRGLALLTIGGNIVVTWSWFGVNELGVGLHAYGGAESSTAMWLLVFGASQLALIAIGLMPQRWFAAIGGSRATGAAQ